MNKWDLLREFVNNNEIIKRTDLNTFGSTSDNYINYLRNIGLIVRISRGVYKRIYKIPMDISSSELLNIAYDDEKIQVFTNSIIIKERKDKIEKIKKGAKL